MGLLLSENDGVNLTIDAPMARKKVSQIALAQKTNILYDHKKIRVGYDHTLLGGQGLHTRLRKRLSALRRKYNLSGNSKQPRGCSSCRCRLGNP
jgi:hypothetical protein